MRIVLFILFTIIIIVLHFNKVDNTITEEDIVYIKKIFPKINHLESDAKFKDEIELINKIQQNAILNTLAGLGSIPQNMPREPKDIFLSNRGACVERSRLIEKSLRYFGFKTKHIAIYSTEKTNSSFRSLITKNNRSHALTEVLTSKGWMVVDSTNIWVGLSIDNMPLDISQIQQKHTVYLKKPMEDILNENFTFLYGVYSRHGKYYYPYTFIPDIEYNEFYSNFFN